MSRRPDRSRIVRFLLPLAICCGLRPAPAQGVQFERELTPGLPIAYAWHAADIDGDGDLDLLGTLGLNPYDLAVARNDGRGQFSTFTSLGIPFTVFMPSLAADIDGDGDVDIVRADSASTTTSTVSIWRNNGAGSFSAGPTFVASGILEALAAGDLDGDGDVDLVTGGDRATQLWRNGGTGAFTFGSTLTPQGRTAVLRIADLDGDGRQDVLCGMYALQTTASSQIRTALPNLVCRNLGNGSFATQPFGSSPTQDLQLGDIDGDGDLDVLELEFEPDTLSAGSGPYATWRNNGAGGFTAWQAWATPTPARWDANLADFDLDGDLDVLASFRAAPPMLEFHENVGGTLSTVPSSARTGSTPVSHVAPVFGDFDGDGDMDVVCTTALPGGLGEVSLWRNLRRHVAPAAPPRIGQPLTYSVFARYAPATVVMPALSLAPAAVPLPPLGVLGLDLNAGVLLSWLFVLPGSGGGSFSLTVPNDANLVGQQVYAQALYVDGNDHLSNVHVDAIGP